MDPVRRRPHAQSATTQLGSKIATGDFGTLAGLSVVATVLWFVFLSLVSVLFGLQTEYIDPTAVLGSAAYFFSFMLVVELVVVAHWIANGRTSWDQVATCFADETAARRRINRWLGWQRDLRPVLVFFAAYNLTIPFWVHKLDPFTSGSHSLFFVINAAVVLATTVIVYFVIVHLLLVRSVLRLELRSVHSAARTFDPLMRFGTRASIGWFALVTLYLIYLYYLVLLPTVESGDGSFVSVAVLDVALRLVESPPNVPFYPDPSGYLSTVVLFTIVGFAMFFAPIWMVHTKLKTTKRERLIEVEEQYDEVVRSWCDEPERDSDVTVELDRIDRIHDATRSIRTWPSDVESVGKLAIASAIPTLQLVVLPIVRAIVSRLS